jgi:RNase adaptor protein for sRNA GlmZ degradation
MMFLTLYTFGVHNEPQIKWNKIYRLHKMGVKLLDHNGHNKRVFENIVESIVPCSNYGENNQFLLALQCDHGLHRSVEMADDVEQRLIRDGWKVSRVNLSKE